MTVRSHVVGGLFVWSTQFEMHLNDASATLDAFTHWLWSGNGFSAERYEKLGLARPKPPSAFLNRVAEEEAHTPAITAGTSYGLEGLRMLEGMEAPHEAGAIVNPGAYADPARKSARPGDAAAKKAPPSSSAAAGLLKSLGSGKSTFGNPSRKFAL